jgi:hypothetical protein
MKPVPSLTAIAVGLALSTATATLLAQDDLEDLEVTMEVVDDARELDAVMTELRGPEEEVEDFDDGMEGPGKSGELMGSEGGLDGQGAELGHAAAPREGDFDSDRLEDSNVRIPESDQAFEDEVDWEEEEHVDQDEYDELDAMYDDAVAIDDEPPF